MHKRIFLLLVGKQWGKHTWRAGGPVMLALLAMTRPCSPASSAWGCWCGCRPGRWPAARRRRGPGPGCSGSQISSHWLPASFILFFRDGPDVKLAGYSPWRYRRISRYPAKIGYWIWYRVRYQLSGKMLGASEQISGWILNLISGWILNSISGRILYIWTNARKLNQYPNGY